MPLIEPIIRPPSEAGSLLLQVTTGCSANTCTFCGAYKVKKYSEIMTEIILGDVDEYARVYPNARKLFLLDGDALAIPQNNLITILDHINKKLPQINRISSYTNDFSIVSRTNVELAALRKRRLRVVYMGLETGSQELLSRCKKKSTVTGMISSIEKLKNAGISTDIMVLLGLGGKEKSKEHIIETAHTLNAMQPEFLAFLSLMLIPGTPLARDAENGRFQELSPAELLFELHEIITQLDLKRTYVRATHASNYLPIEGRLPHDKDRILSTIQAAMRGEISLKPEFFRGL
ncbi:MAG: radical SAM protein [Spirochaetales bacterium]|nr:radical SAM protein [Spirochaetales bacterium]